MRVSVYGYNLLLAGYTPLHVLRLIVLCHRFAPHGYPSNDLKYCADVFRTSAVFELWVWIKASTVWCQRIKKTRLEPVIGL